MRKSAPFPIITACFSDLGNQDGTGGVWFPIEFTPLYCGVPMEYTTPTGTMGGGFIESVGFGSPAPTFKTDRKEVANHEEVEVCPRHYVSLGFAAGVSSSALAVENVDSSTSQQQREGNEVLDLWSPADLHSENNRLTNVMDGGPMDNTAILALLRRGCPRIIASVAEKRPTENPDFPKSIWWAALWGRAHVGISNTAADADELNDRCRVFDPMTFDEFMVGVKDKIAKGLPPVIEQTLDVRANPRNGVVGGYKVKILWVLSGLAEVFRARLPKDTKDLLKRKPTFSGGAKNLSIVLQGMDIDNTFPFDKTFYGEYNSRLVRLLAENSAFNLIEGSKGLIEDYFRAPEGIISQIGNIIM